MDRYFYSVEETDGHKEVHFSGNIHFNNADETDKCFRLAEWTGLYVTVDELRELLEDDMLWEYINGQVTYLTNLTEDGAIDMCKVYFDGSSGTKLDIRSIDEETPCGDYWFE